MRIWRGPVIREIQSNVYGKQQKWPCDLFIKVLQHNCKTQLMERDALELSCYCVNS